MDGIAATAAILASRPDACVLVLTTFDEDALVRDAVRAGAAGYLLKGMPLDEMLSVLHLALRGYTTIGPRVASSSAMAGPRASRCRAAFRTRGADLGPLGGRLHQSRHRRTALHHRGDGQELRLGHPRGAGRPPPHGGRAPVAQPTREPLRSGLRDRYRRCLLVDLVAALRQIGFDHVRSLRPAGRRRAVVDVDRSVGVDVERFVELPHRRVVRRPTTSSQIRCQVSVAFPATFRRALGRKWYRWSRTRRSALTYLCSCRS